MDQHNSRSGLFFGLGAYVLWGMIPLYFKSVSHVPPMQVLAHRVLWSCVFLAVLVTWIANWNAIRRALGNAAVLRTLLLSTLLIGINWLTYIYAVDSEQILQASLGYFITPLVNVVLGILFLKERLRRGQLCAVLLAACGVVNLAIAAGELPWIATTLAFSFGLYGLLRKTVAVDGLTGLFVETAALSPLAAIYLGVVAGSGQADAAFADSGTLALLLSSGVITAIPLLLFAGAARRLRLATLGLLQYLAPTLQFLLAVLAFGEPFSLPQLVTFVCIWTAVIIYSTDSLRAHRRQLAVQASHPLVPDAETPAVGIDAVVSQPEYSPSLQPATKQIECRC